MPKKSKKPLQQVVNKGGYWTYRFRDEGGGEHTLRFGNVNKVLKAQADAELQRHLAAAGDSAQTPTSGFLAIEEVCQLFIHDAEGIYRRHDGTATGEALNLVHGLQPLVRILGKLACVYLRPRHLKEFCDSQAKAKVSRSVINKRLGYIRRMLAWAKNEELLPPVKAPGDSVPIGAFDACRDFPMMRQGRPARSGGTIPRETVPIRSVPDETVQQTIPFLTPTVRTMIALQQLASMRPSEVCWLKMAEVDTTQEPWLYMPSRHKTKHRGKERRIYFGPKAREILKPYRLRVAGSFVFRPADAKAEAGDFDIRAGGDRFNTRSYRDAIWRACDRAFPAPAELRGAFLELRRLRAKLKLAAKNGEPVPFTILKPFRERAKAESDWLWQHRWSPNQLRHSGLTEIVQRELAAATERARVVAGHGSQKTTRAYIDPSDELAAAVMEQAG
jgi:hypothetical protein